MVQVSIWLFIGLVLFGYVFELILDILNISHKNKPIPPQVADVYSDEAYAKQQKYEKVTTQFSIFQGVISTSIIVMLLVFGVFGWLHGTIAELGFGKTPATLLFFGVILLVSKVFSLPFSIYGTFVIEERFGFNRITPKLFIIDSLKSLLLSVVIGGVILFVITWLFYSTGKWFWVLALAVALVFTFIANILYSRVIVPLFNKQEPLKEGSLRDLIFEFAQKVNFPLTKVFVIDGSKRSTKANAYFSGFGKNRRVVLYDTLIEKMSETEVLAVLAHEIGHFRKKHIWINLVIGNVQAGAYLFLFTLLSTKIDVASALGFAGSTEAIFHLSLIGFGILTTPLDLLLSLATNRLSRKMEYQADVFAKQYKLDSELISGLKKLSAENLSNLTPHPAYVFVHYSHPTLVQRIGKLSD
jgi:STE24 endopeptidase